MTAPLVLSLFPGIGLLDMAFEQEGFCVVRGPDLLWGGDIRSFHPPSGRFDGVIGGPPCQVHSGMSDLNPLAGRKHGDQIPEFERCVAEAVPSWFLMENVPRAPIPRIPDWCIREYIVHSRLVQDVAVGGETTRERRFTFGSNSLATTFYVQELALHRPDPELTVLAGHGPAAGQRVRGIEGRTWQQCAKLQGLPDEWIARISENAILTVHGYKKVIGNGVPLAMGRAVARAVRRALYPELKEGAA